jgi:hypothetical protein
MSRVTVPPLTETIVIERGGWHPRYAEVLAIASDGRYGFALVDGNGDRSELESEIWIFEEGRWSPDSSEGDGPRWYSRPWSSGWGGGSDADDGFAFIYGFAPGWSTVDITTLGETHRLSVGTNHFWAFLRAGDSSPDDRSVSLNI